MASTPQCLPLSTEIQSSTTFGVPLRASFKWYRIRLLVYVDDCLLISKSSILIRAVKSELQRKFQITDLGPATYFLGVEIEVLSHGLFLQQHAYIQEVLAAHHMLSCRSSLSPMDPGSLIDLTRPHTTTTIVLSHDLHSTYRTAIGQLLYLTTKTRSDIAAAVGVLARQVACLAMIHVTAVKRVHCYLKGTSDCGIRICPTTDKLIGHADSDWAGESARKSVSGFSATLGDVPAAWWSKKQTAVALSSTEAEYASLSETSKEMWLRGLCKARGHKQNGGTMITLDNTGSLCWANGTAKFGRSQHVDIKLHHVQHLVHSEEISLQQVGTSEMKADLLTKPLSGSIFKKSRDSLQTANQVAPGKPVCDDNADQAFTAVLGVSGSSKVPVEHQDRYDTCRTRTRRKWSNENVRRSHM
jgi:Reverse transcriptase (RNA-dependent DNA polymerase)